MKKLIGSTMLLLWMGNMLWAQPATQMSNAVHITEISPTEQLPPGIKLEGKRLDAVTFYDKGGLNYIVASETKHEKELRNDLFVAQYRIPQDGATAELVWDIRDFATPLCRATIADHSLQVLDLDGDGWMESVFMYQMLCDGLDPTVTKVMLHHKGVKLALRGTIPVAEQTELVQPTLDPLLTEYPPLFGNYLLFEWESFIRGHLEHTFSRTVYLQGPEATVIESEYGFTSGGIHYDIFNGNGQLIELDDEDTFLSLQYASSLQLTPNGKYLFFNSMEHIGFIDLARETYIPLLKLYEKTEAVSPANWSPDGRRVAFAVCNREDYPTETQIFVLDLDGTRLVKKHKFMVPVSHMAASVMVVSAPFFENNNQLKYPPSIESETIESLDLKPWGE